MADTRHVGDEEARAALKQLIPADPAVRRRVYARLLRDLAPRTEDATRPRQADS